MSDQADPRPAGDAAGDMDAMSSAGSDVDFLFALTGTGLGMNLNGRIIVKGVSATTLYFSDRPYHLTGSMATQDLVSQWDVGDDTFGENPPNALISCFDDNGVSNLVVVLTEPALDNDELSFAVEVLTGNLVPSHGPVNVVIDSLGAPAIAALADTSLN